MECRRREGRSLLAVPHGQLGYFSSSSFIFFGVVVGTVVVAAVVVAGFRSLDTRNEIFTSVIC